MTNTMTNLQVKLIKTKDGLLAQCPDNPEIIVTGKNKSEITKNIHEIMDGYIEAFPEMKSNLPGNGVDFKIAFQ